MNDNDIKKCKKNGYVWLDNCGIILRVNNGSCLWPEKNQWGMLCFHATRAAAQAAIDERVAKRKADAAHAKMLEDGKHQTTPITPEQAKMLRVGDEFFYLQHGGGAPKYHVTLDKLKRSPDITKWKCFVNGLAYFTHEAALDKNKGVGSHETPKSETQHKEVVTDETQDKEPVKWAERTKGDIVLEGDDVSDANKKFDLQDTSSDIIFSVVHSWMEANGWIGKIVGEQTNYGHIIRARYLTPEWKAWKERKDAKAKPETPAYPPKSKQVKDGWTDEEIEKAAFKTKEWTDIPQVVTKRNTDDSVTHPKHYTSHPSGIECIQVTEHMNFCRGNAVKYVWRAGEKGDEIEDLKKARWYLDREIARLEKAKEQND